MNLPLIQNQINLAVSSTSAMPTPSIHNLPRLAPKENTTQQENKNKNGAAFSQAA